MVSQEDQQKSDEEIDPLRDGVRDLISFLNIDNFNVDTLNREDLEMMREYIMQQILEQPDEVQKPITDSK